jgi:hypothetical protein
MGNKNILMISIYFKVGYLKKHKTRQKKLTWLISEVKFKNSIFTFFKKCNNASKKLDLPDQQGQV